jgi:uncharacterized Zn finger protein (UPF0148 family)
MKIRGERECKECGTRWSYYGTGTITCPNCGSVYSVGVDERTEHTASPVELDLGRVMAAVETDPLQSVAEQAADRAQEYVHTYGFIHAGDLQPLEAQYVTVQELRHVAGELARSIRISDDEQLYFLSLLQAADAGDRTPRSAVPESLAAARGLAAARAVDAYRRDLRRYLEAHPDDDARRTLGTIADHQKRIEALDGAVALEQADTLVEAARDLGAYLRGDESALAIAQDRLQRLTRSLE